MSKQKINVEIWSDIACPFCYIGKRNFEKALASFAHKDKVSIVWKSFQLMPEAKKENNISIHEMLAARYGRSLHWAKQMNEQVGKTAKEVGLNFNFDKMQFTNTFDAHQLIHLAKKYNLQDKAKEKLLSAYFVEGLHVGRKETLLQIAKELGLEAEKVEKMLETNEYSKDVKNDIMEGQQHGLTGVPFFIFNQKYAISGAQPSKVFLELLESIAKEEDFSTENLETETACATDGTCAV